MRGTVKAALLRKGTGSEHEAVVLETDDGSRLALVRLGANPFEDPETRRLVGRKVEVVGYRLGADFRYVEAREIK